MKYEVCSLVCLVVAQIVSLLCALYILFEFFKKRSQLRCLHNHAIVALLVVSAWLISVDLLCTEFYYWNNYVPIQTAWACRFYNFSLFTASGLNRLLMAFMTVERHFLVFRVQIYRSARARLLLHYFPVVIIILVAATYSAVTDLIITCPQTRFRYSYFLCNYTCSILLMDLALFYIYVLVFVPTMITIIACVLLPIRFAIQKRTLQQFHWRRARKMIIHTILICGAYTICWFPYAVLLQLTMNNLVSLGDPHVARFMIFAPYVTSLVTPLVCFYTTTTELKLFISRWVHRYFLRRRQRRIVARVKNCRPVVTHH